MGTCKPHKQASKQAKTNTNQPANQPAKEKMTESYKNGGLAGSTEEQALTAVINQKPSIIRHCHIPFCRLWGAPARNQSLFQSFLHVVLTANSHCCIVLRIPSFLLLARSVSSGRACFEDTMLRASCQTKQRETTDFEACARCGPLVKNEHQSFFIDFE